MKKVRLVVMMLVFILGISGCSFSDANDYDSVRDISDTIIYVDFETNVMYAWCKRGYVGGFSVMLNPDGLPKLYDKATSKYTNIRDISDTIIYVDFETNVMYAWCKRGYGGGFSVMLNPDGLPKLYDKATSIYTNVRDINDTNVYVDFETNVMYAWCKRGYGGGFSIMLKPDGLPKLYE